MPFPVLAIACLLTVTFGYVAVCAASPLATCRKCDGLGYQVKFNRRGKPKRSATAAAATATASASE
ncbi:hypothetical protein ABZS88_07000 [Streptomyces sp. NPDC005480]|uniref:hypothetical protein n=1 Tax=Streptomyces sp. NPDC005480 TaxID=3154880 RepID=UPI0033BFA5A1